MPAHIEEALADDLAMSEARTGRIVETWLYVAIPPNDH